MDYTLSAHAKARMRERGIRQEDVQDAIDHSTIRSTQRDGRTLIKKVYTREGKQRLLLIAGEHRKNIFNIITVIDTSKVNKYL